MVLHSSPNETDMALHLHTLKEGANPEWTRDVKGQL